MLEYEFKEVVIINFATAIEKLALDGWEYYCSRGHKDVFRRIKRWCNKKNNYKEV